MDARMVGLMRLVLGLSALIIIYIDPSEPDRLVPVTYLSLVCFCVYAALVYLFSARRPDSKLLGYALWVDVAWYLLLVGLSSGTNSIFFFFFFYSILTASFRSGFAHGFSLTFASAALFTLVGYLTAPPEPEFQLNRFMLRPIYLLVLGYMMSFWGGREVTFKQRLALLKEVNRLSNPRFGVETTIHSIMERARVFFGAVSCLLVVSRPGSPQSLLYRVESAPARGAARAERLPPDSVRPMLALPERLAVLYCAARGRWLRGARYHAFDVETHRRSDEGEELTRGLYNLIGRSFISVPLRGRGQVEGRIFVVRGREPFDPSDLDFLLQVIEQAQPVIENIRLLDRLASEAAEQERLKISRDLHDSTVQPYLGIKFGLESLRRKFRPGEPHAEDLDDLLGMVNDAVGDLRRYIRQLKTESSSSEAVLLPAIRRQAEKFSSFYGIQVEVRPEEGFQVNDRLAAEVFQIVREGLSNIRKHTGARRAFVSLGCTDSHLRLRIENDNDDGEAPPALFAPRSISERATSLGGHARVEVRADGHTAVNVIIPT